MDPRLIEELGEGAFAVAVEPIKRERKCRLPVIGFDTEYDSETRELLSFQLATEERAAFVACRKLTVDKLAEAVRPFVEPSCGHVMLAAYFSIAELQHLPVIEEAVEVKSFGASVDVVFYSRRWELLIHVFDLARFWQSPRKPLAAVAQSYGLKKAGGVNRKAVSVHSLKSETFRAYAIQDARLCFQIARKLREGFEPDGVDPLFEGSAASSAAAAFRMGLESTLHPPAARVRLMGLLCCWGGRAEALERGSFTRLHEYDIVSAYPRAAISLGVMPCKGDWKKVTSWRGFNGAVGGLGRFRFRFPPGAVYPCLPVWTRKCQIYPLQGESYCTLDEARLAVEMGATLHVVEAFGFWSGSSALPDFLSRVVKERAKADDPVRRTALKLLANALIGKLAQRVVEPDMDALLKLARRKELSLGQFVRLTREECKALGIPFIVRLGSLFYPEWNSLITGRVRAILGRAISERQAVYASTDAIWTRQKRAPANRLGASWDLVRSGAAIVARTRLARIGEHVAHHSIWRKDAGEKVLAQVAKGTEREVRYRIQRPLKLKESLAKGEHYGKWIEEERTGAGIWDHKRALGSAPGRSDGGSRPWKSATEYLEAATADAKARQALARRSRSRSNSGRAGKQARIPPR